MDMKIPLIDLDITFKEAEEEIRINFDQIFRTHRYVLGPFQKRLEDFIKDHTGSGYAVSVSSGTDALLVIMMALEIGEGDEVILPDFTFFATAGTVARLGAKPVFCDIDEKTQNIDPAQIISKITDRTKAIIPVHIFGQSCDMDPIMRIADEYGLFVIEDACQSIFCRYKGRFTGSIGKASAYSFFPSKNLGGLGDSGMVTTNDKDLFEKIIFLRNHGQTSGYYHTMIGGNFRMDEFQAAGLLAKARFLEKNNNMRRENARLYRECFEERGLLRDKNLILPHEQFDHIYHQYVIRAKNRDGLRDHLAGNNIGCAVYYPLPLHRQPCFEYLKNCDSDFPVTNIICNEALGLPVFPGLKNSEIRYIADKIHDFYSRC